MRGCRHNKSGCRCGPAPSRAHDQPRGPERCIHVQSKCRSINNGDSDKCFLNGWGDENIFMDEISYAYPCSVYDKIFMNYQEACNLHYIIRAVRVYLHACTQVGKHRGSRAGRAGRRDGGYKVVVGGTHDHLWRETYRCVYRYAVGRAPQAILGRGIYYIIGSCNSF